MDVATRQQRQFKRPAAEKSDYVWQQGASLVSECLATGREPPFTPEQPRLANAAQSMAFAFGQENSWVRVQNIGDAPASVTVSYYSEDGRLLGTDS